MRDLHIYLEGTLYKRFRVRSAWENKSMSEKARELILGACAEIPPFPGTTKRVKVVTPFGPP